MPEFPRNPNGRPWITPQRRRFISVASANATRCRIAFDSDGLSSRSAAHASTARRSSGGMRTPTIGECPVAGRPRLLFLCLTPIVIKECLTQNPLSGSSRNRRPRGKAGTKPQGLPQHPPWCRAISRGGTLCSASFDQPVGARPALPMERPLPRRGGFTLFRAGRGTSLSERGPDAGTMNQVRPTVRSWHTTLRVSDTRWRSSAGLMGQFAD
jgi:hypothetical protein